MEVFGTTVLDTKDNAMLPEASVSFFSKSKNSLE